MQYSGVKVLVTGADGFIGSHLAERLVGLGAEVTALCLYDSFGRLGWLDTLAPAVRDALTPVRGDIRDAGQMLALCRGQEVVFHLAALISIPYSFEAPSSFIQTNVQGTANVLAAAQDAGISRIVQTSTSEVYGTAQFTPITEDHPLQGQSPYAASKIGADFIAESFHRTYETPVVTLRPFNTYGPRQSERAVISTVIRQLLDPEAEVLRLGSLSPARDFNFVGDTVSAFLAAAGLEEAHLGKVFNAGSGRMVTIGEVVETLKRVTGVDRPVIQEQERLRPEGSEVMALMADASRLTAACGWKPEVTLDQGLAETVAWWRENLHTAATGVANLT